MPHRRRLSSPRYRRAWPALALLGVLAGCGTSAPSPDADSVAASPSPAPSAVPNPEELARRERARALADSAARVDSAFQRLRDSLNAASRALAGADRTSPDYARRWDAFVARERDAVRLRARRDSLRVRAAASID
ncbi:MAG TPA: hypothetical protein VFZ11_05140 [Gemmatimonadaceae bacterium]